MTDDARFNASHRALMLAQYKRIDGNEYEGPYYFATITREHEGPGYKINFRRKPVENDPARTA